MKPRLKIGIVCICLNPPYWEFAKGMMESANKFLLKNHDVEFMLWSDLPEDVNYGAKVFSTEPMAWPYPTLLRYHLFLQQEEYLKQFDYIFYTDVDMLYVAEVGDEILGDGLTAAQHPGYAVRREYIPPYEPNPDSTAYINRPGCVVIEDGIPRFEPLYFAGGFQGGKTESFITAMKVMKESIDTDLDNNYMAIWNDETHWNRYLYSTPPALVLSPSYIYPDSLINEYYIPLWGKNYPPKIVTLTKKFTVSKEGGEELKRKLETMKAK